MLESEGPGARLLDRPPDPEAVALRREQRLAAMRVVEQHPEARPARRHPGRGLDREALEPPDALARAPSRSARLSSCER